MTREDNNDKAVYCPKFVEGLDLDNAHHSINSAGVLLWHNQMAGDFLSCIWLYSIQSKRSLASCTVQLDKFI